MADVDELPVPLQWIGVATNVHRELLERLDGLLALGLLEAVPRRSRRSDRRHRGECSPASG